MRVLHPDQLVSVTGGIFDHFRYKLFGPGAFFGRDFTSWDDYRRVMRNLQREKPDWSVR